MWACSRHVASDGDDREPETDSDDHYAYQCDDGCSVFSIGTSIGNLAGFNLSARLYLPYTFPSRTKSGSSLSTLYPVTETLEVVSDAVWVKLLVEGGSPHLRMMLPCVLCY